MAHQIYKGAIMADIFYDGHGNKVEINSRIKYKGDPYNPPIVGTVIQLGEQDGEFVITIKWDDGGKGTICDCHPYYELVT